jgi:hypothetical protein
VQELGWQVQAVPRRGSKIFLLQLQLQMRSKTWKSWFLPSQISGTTLGLGGRHSKMCVYLANHFPNANSLQQIVWYIDDVTGKAAHRLQCAKLLCATWQRGHCQLIVSLASCSSRACTCALLQPLGRCSGCARHCRAILKSLGQCPGHKSWLVRLDCLFSAASDRVSSAVVHMLCYTCAQIAAQVAFFQAPCCNLVPLGP